MAARLESAYPATNRGWGVTVVPLHDSVTGDVRRPLLVLLAFFGLLVITATPLYQVPTRLAAARDRLLGRTPATEQNEDTEPPANPNCVITQDRSISGDTPSEITFDNQSGETVSIYWLDYEGDRIHYTTLAPGARLVSTEQELATRAMVRDLQRLEDSL